MKQKLAWFGAVVGWFAVIAQYILMLVNNNETAVEMTIRFFSYFTLLTNSLAAIFFTAIITTSPRLNFFRKHGVSTAIALYILIVGLVYQLLLRNTWNPQGFQLIVDQLLHAVTPIFFCFYWYKFELQNPPAYKEIPKWLIFPIVYFVFVILRGSISGFYPYPFLDAGKLEIKQLVINVAGLVVVFCFLASLLVTVGQLIKRK